MIVSAQALRLVNIGQLISVATEGTTVMGKLDRVKHFTTSRKVSLRVSGDTVTVDEGHLVNIRRSAEAHELKQVTDAVDDLSEILESVEA